MGGRVVFRVALCSSLCGNLYDVAKTAVHHCMNLTTLRLGSGE
jgi:hypothetical protein